jgi:site-specific recombinase XerD
MQMDLQLINYSPRTIESYLHHVNKFFKYFQQTPEEFDEDDIRKYLYYFKTEKKMSSSNLAQAFSAVKSARRRI